MDIVVSAVALAALALPMAVVGLLIRLEDAGPALFRQRRVGRGKRQFQMYKFRSMAVSAPDLPTYRLREPERYITRIGRLLRRSSVDELPQLWNILLGDMTLVGPRPAQWNQEELVWARERYGANDIRPGLTGWAQVNGRDELTVEEKARLDGEYVQRMGFWFDLACLGKTVTTVIRGTGLVEGGTGARNQPTTAEQPATEAAARSDRG